MIAPVRVEALFECYDGESAAYLNIVWFQDEFSATIATSIESIIIFSRYFSEIAVIVRIGHTNWNDPNIIDVDLM